jgi:hypothetical protein
VLDEVDALTYRWSGQPVGTLGEYSGNAAWNDQGAPVDAPAVPDDDIPF